MNVGDTFYAQVELTDSHRYSHETVVIRPENNSDIRCIAIDDERYTFERLNPYYNGETFSLFRSTQAFERSHWIAR